MNQAILFSLAFSIQLIVCLLSIVAGFLVGRHYAIIRRKKLPVQTTDDDIVHDLKQSLGITPKPRIISPSKRAASSLTDLEKDVI